MAVDFDARDKSQTFFKGVSDANTASSVYTEDFKGFKKVSHLRNKTLESLEIPKSDRCTGASGISMKCGHYTRSTSGFDSRRKGVIHELKLSNTSPVRLHLFYRLPLEFKDATKYKIAVIPTGKFMYVYHYVSSDGEKSPLLCGGTLHAKCDNGSYLYLPYITNNYDNMVCFGAADTTTMHSRVIYNLMGEIMFIEFHNQSNAVYDVYYYGDYLGTLYPVGLEGAVFRSNNHNQGYRLNSTITLLMRGTKNPQSILITNHRMDTLNIGVVRGYSIQD